MTSLAPHSAAGNQLKHLRPSTPLALWIDVQQDNLVSSQMGRITSELSAVLENFTTSSEGGNTPRVTHELLAMPRAPPGWCQQNCMYQSNLTTWLVARPECFTPPTSFWEHNNMFRKKMPAKQPHTDLQPHKARQGDCMCVTYFCQWGKCRGCYSEHWSYTANLIKAPTGSFCSTFYPQQGQDHWAQNWRLNQTKTVRFNRI